MTKTTNVRSTIARAATAWLIAAMTAITLAGCAAPQAAVSTVKRPFDEGIEAITDALIEQGPRTLGFGSNELTRAALMVDPMIDADSGQRTVDSKRLQESVLRRIHSRYPLVKVLAFEDASLGQPSYVLTGTIARIDRRVAAEARNAGSGVAQVQLALIELRTGMVVAQSSGRLDSRGLDGMPLAFDQDSPVLAQDRVVDGYIRSAATPPGQPANKSYVDQIRVAPLVSSATSSYEAGQYERALSQFNAASAMQGGEQLRVLSGIYLAAVKLEHQDEARLAFRRIVEHGIARRQLGVKFLFNPGATSFWSDPKISGAYPMWLAQIAQGTVQAKVCVDVVGHTSHTGAESLNDSLSLNRAEAIRTRLVGEQIELLRRTRSVGRGFRDNIIGTGTDNAADALDRRVVFKIVPCAG